MDHSGFIAPKKIYIYYITDLEPSNLAIMTGHVIGCNMCKKELLVKIPNNGYATANLTNDRWMIKTIKYITTNNTYESILKEFDYTLDNLSF